MIYTLAEATAPWLSAVLKQPVLNVIRRPNTAFNSTIAHLDVIYGPGASPDIPRQLLIKLNDQENGQEEAGFYQVINSGHASSLPMLVRCLSADYEPATGNSYCLLVDVSATHLTPITRDQVLGGEAMPTATQLNQMIDALAEFHAYWWEHARLGSDVTAVRWWYRDQEGYQQHIKRREKEWLQFVDDVGGEISSEQRALYGHCLASLPKLWDGYLRNRVIPPRNLTLSNGDCYFAQFLCAKHPDVDSHAYLVDFQDVSANFGPYDLVYMMATFWTSAQRQTNGLEDRLLHRYHTRLEACGVNNYSWDDCFRDYKMMIVFMIFDPVWNQVSGSSSAYWQPKMHCLTNAFQDLNCAQLLDSL